MIRTSVKGSGRWSAGRGTANAVQAAQNGLPAASPPGVLDVAGRDEEYWTSVPFTPDHRVQYNPATGTGRYPRATSGYIQVVDFTDPAEPEMVARYEVSEHGTHNLWVENRILYQAYYEGASAWSTSPATSWATSTPRAAKKPSSRHMTPSATAQLARRMERDAAQMPDLLLRHQQRAWVAEAPACQSTRELIRASVHRDLVGQPVSRGRIGSMGGEGWGRHICLDIYITCIEYIIMQDVFHLLADPTRRQLMELLRRGESSVGELVGATGASQPAVSRNLRLLREGGLVAVRADGQRRLYRILPERLRELDAWLEPYRQVWSGRLDELERHLDEMPD